MENCFLIIIAFLSTFSKQVRSQHISKPVLSNICDKAVSMCVSKYVFELGEIYLFTYTKMN